MKQLFFVHGGDSLKQGEDFFEHWESDAVWKPEDPFVKSDKKKWKDDLVEQLGSEWACAFPRFPNDMDAHYPEWKWWMDKYVPFMKDGVVLVGHSLGGNFLVKYLAENDFPVAIGQLHLIAPCWSEGDFVMPKDFSRFEKIESVHLYFSKDDPLIPFETSVQFHEAIPHAALIVFEDRGHFFSQESFPELVARITGIH